MKKIVVLLLIAGMCWAGDSTTTITNGAIINSPISQESFYRNVCKMDTVGWESQIFYSRDITWQEVDWVFPEGGFEAPLIYHGRVPPIFHWEPIIEEHCHFESINPELTISVETLTVVDSLLYPEGHRITVGDDSVYVEIK